MAVPGPVEDRASADADEWLDVPGSSHGVLVLLVLSDFFYTDQGWGGVVFSFFQTMSDVWCLGLVIYKTYMS